STRRSLKLDRYTAQQVDSRGRHTQERTSRPEPSCPSINAPGQSRRYNRFTVSEEAPLGEAKGRLALACAGRIGPIEPLSDDRTGRQAEPDNERHGHSAVKRETAQEYAGSDHTR